VTGVNAPATPAGPPLERREGWGMSIEGVCRVVYPKSADDIRDAFALARANGWRVAFWGNGRSYGDAALNEGQLLLDFSQMDRILEWDRVTGRVVVEPGVTLEKLWKHCLPDSFWPPVVSGTMFTSIGGLASANAHGKNNWKHGPIGDHIDWFEILTPDGVLRRVDRDHDAELFHAAIGGFGWLGAFVRVALTMKKVYSGRIDVLPFTAPDLDGMFKGFERCNQENWDYVVGWIDAFPGGASLGRGQIHAARYFELGEDPEGASMLSLGEQELPDRFFGVVPKGWLWWFAKPWANQLGMRVINLVRFMMMNRDSHHHRFRQPHAQFNFLLDYVPNWKWVYKPGGLIQYQLFLPKERAQDVARRTLELCQQARLEPWLVVMKRHRADKFWLSHAVDGYSFAMDFPVDDARREDLWRLTQILNEMVVEAGGRFYFAKDAVVSPDAVRRSLGGELLSRFFRKKQELDPEELISSSLYRRVMAPLRQSYVAERPSTALDEPHLPRGA
jgi:decaprenylphospho-beta-D-ribofuranose 2-oxidase